MDYLLIGTGCFLVGSAVGYATCVVLFALADVRRTDAEIDEANRQLKVRNRNGTRRI